MSRLRAKSAPRLRWQWDTGVYHTIDFPGNKVLWGLFLQSRLHTEGLLSLPGHWGNNNRPVLFRQWQWLFVLRLFFLDGSGTNSCNNVRVSVHRQVGQWQVRLQPVLLQIVRQKYSRAPVLRNRVLHASLGSEVGAI